MSYSPVVGRFMQRDPLGYVDGGSLYQYVRGRPLLTTDASGLAGPIAIGGGPIVIIVGACGVPYYFAAMELYGGRSDKFRHCWASCMIARQCGTGISIVGGVAKEGGDLIKGNPVSDGIGDIQANIDGYAIAGIECSVNLGMVTRWFRQSCEAGCNAKGY